MPGIPESHQLARCSMNIRALTQQNTPSTWRLSVRIDTMGLTNAWCNRNRSQLQNLNAWLCLDSQMHKIRHVACCRGASAQTGRWQLKYLSAFGRTSCIQRVYMAVLLQEDAVHVILGRQQTVYLSLPLAFNLCGGEICTTARVIQCVQKLVIMNNLQPLCTRKLVHMAITTHFRYQHRSLVTCSNATSP